MSIKSVHAAVIRGVRFLDKNDPNWWENGTTPNGIDISKLDLHEANRCILGYRCGGYYAGLNRFGLADVESLELGFTLNFTAPREGWSILTEAWIAVILARRHPRRKHPAWVEPVRKAAA